MRSNESGVAEVLKLGVWTIIVVVSVGGFTTEETAECSGGNLSDGKDRVGFQVGENEAEDVFDVVVFNNNGEE